MALPLETENPQEPLSLAAEVQGGFDDGSLMPARLDRYGVAKSRAVKTLGHIRSVVNGPKAYDYTDDQLDLLRTRAAKLQDCGEFLHFREYPTVNKVRLRSANFCKAHLICPLCAIRRGAKALKAYLDRYEVIDAPYYKLSMITFTVKDGPDLSERFDHLKSSISKCIQRRRSAKAGVGVVTEWSKIIGAVGSYEVKRGSGQGLWHPHVHMMVIHRDNFDWQALKDEWFRITGDSHVVNVQAARHPGEPARDFVEVFKYALKFSDMEQDDIIDAFLALQGRQMLFSLGSFRGVDVPEDLTDAELLNLPFIDLFYSWRAGSYSLAATRKGVSHAELDDITEEPWFIDPDSDESVVVFHAMQAFDRGKLPLLYDRHRIRGFVVPFSRLPENSHA